MGYGELGLFGNSVARYSPSLNSRRRPVAVPLGRLHLGEGGLYPGGAIRRVLPSQAFRGTGTSCNPLIPHGLLDIGFVWYFLFSVGSLLRTVRARTAPGMLQAPNHIVSCQSKGAALLSELRCFE